jgi:Tfp pilus assembly protein PilN
MQAVNLLPAYARPAGKWASVGRDLSPARVIRLGAIIAVAAAVIVGALYFFERQAVSDRHASLSDAKARLAAVDATAAPLHAAESSSTARSGVIHSVVATRVVWEKVLRDLALVLPGQVYLTSLQIQPAVAPVSTSALGSTSTSTSTSTPTSTSTSTTSTPAAPVPSWTGFTVSGSANSQTRVALVLDRLALLPWLSGVTLQSSTRSGGTGTSTAGDQFSITGTFNDAGVTG